MGMALRRMATLEGVPCMGAIKAEDMGSHSQTKIKTQGVLVVEGDMVALFMELLRQSPKTTWAVSSGLEK